MLPVGVTNITVVLFGTLVVAAVLLALGLLFIFSGWRPFGSRRGDTQHDLGMALVSGAIFGLAVFALQLYLEKNNQEVQERRDEAAREETVQLAIATTKDLSGFDPRGESLKGTYLVGKILDGARFGGADLRGAQLRDTSLRGAEFKDAKLQGANLINADLSETVLDGANLAGAELKLANFDGAQMFSIKSLEGAIVDARTCWPPAFLRSAAWQQFVTTLQQEPSRAPDGRVLAASPGHPCGEGKQDTAGPPD